MKEKKKHEIRLSYKCNNNCRFCEVADQKETYLEPGLEEVKVRLLQDKEYEIAEFFGGEPTISPYFLKLLRFITEQGKSSKINTNCRMFSYKEYSRKIAREKISHIATSVESHKAEVHDHLTRTNGSFRQTIDGIKNAKQEGIEVNTTAVMMKQNIHDLKKNSRSHT